MVLDKKFCKCIEGLKFFKDLKDKDKGIFLFIIKISIFKLYIRKIVIFKLLLILKKEKICLSEFVFLN